MSRVWIVARRELRGFFDHPTAYVLAVAFLGLAFFLAFRSLYSLGTADLRSFIDILPWLFAVFVPAVTMRSLAEERSRGTLEWLVSQPLTEVELVAGKLLGAWLFVLATLAGTLPMAAGVLVVGHAHPGPMVAQYLGAALLAAELTAVGVFASALTRNQITAFIVAALVSVALVLAGTGFTLVALPAAVAAVVGRLAVIPHFDSVARGVVDLRDALYFLTTALLFGGLATFLVARERLSRTRGSYRRLRAGVAAGALAVVVVNLVGQHIHGRLDLTADHLYTLAGGTDDVLHGLDDIVTVKLFVSRDLPPEFQTTLRDVRDMLDDYRRTAGGNVRVEELHPDRDDDARQQAQTLGIQQVQFNVMRQDQVQIQNGWLGLSLQYADQHRSIPFVRSTDDLEYRLTSAIASLTEAHKPRIAFVTGYGARSPYQMPELSQMLSDRYDVATLTLEPDSTGHLAPISPDSFDVVALVGPSEKLAPAAVSELEDYLDAGGAGLFFLENNTVDPRSLSARPLDVGLGPLLRSRGVRLTASMAYDVRSNQTVSLGRRSVFDVVAPYPLWPVAVPAARHPTTQNLEELAVAWAGVLQVTDSSRVTPLWATSAYGGEKPASGSIDPQTSVTAASIDAGSLGPQILAVAVKPGPAAGDSAKAGGGRLVVVGDADLLRSQFVQANPQNLSFAANAVDWLAQDERLIEIRSKDRTPPPLVFGSDAGKETLRWGNMVGVPLLFVALGLFRSRARHRRAEELWRSVQAEGEEEAS